MFTMDQAREAMAQVGRELNGAVIDGPIEIDWDRLPSEEESTLVDDMCDLGDLNGGLPLYVILTAMDNMAVQSPGHGVFLDALTAEITRVAHELVERGTSNA